MKAREEEELVTALKEQINIERAIERAKINLALKSDFNLLDAFRTFDPDGKGFVSRYEFDRCLKKYGVFPMHTEADVLFKRLDTDSDGFISYSEFVEEMVPYNLDYAIMLKTRSPSFVPLPFETDFVTIPT